MSDQRYYWGPIPAVAAEDGQMLAAYAREAAAQLGVAYVEGTAASGPESTVIFVGRS